MQGLVIHWNNVKRARGYELRITCRATAAALLRTTTPGRRMLTIGGLERNDTGAVAVGAIDDNASPRKPRTARLRAKRHNRSVHKMRPRLLRHPLTAAPAVAAALAIGPPDAAVAAQHRAQPHIAAQNTWFTDANVRRYGVRNDVISISGHWFLQEGTLGGDFADFLAKTREDVERRLGAFKAAHPEVDRDTRATIVMDIESPHPSGLHAYGAGDQDAIVDAYRVRIAATKAAFPNAKLALYGTLNPDHRGRSDDPVYLARLNALIEAGEEGLYDDLDDLVPVLYVRFGCDDEVSGPCDRYWDTLDDYTRLGIDGSSQLRRSDGSSLPLLPLLGFKVYNGNSLFNRELLMSLGVPDPLDATLRTQIDTFADNGVGQFALWTGRDDNELGGPSDPTVTDYLCELFRRRCR